LVTRHAHEKARVFERLQARASVGIEIVPVDIFADSRVEPGLAFLAEVESGPEVLEHFPVVAAESDQSAQIAADRRAASCRLLVITGDTTATSAPGSARREPACSPARPGGIRGDAAAVPARRWA
jgi:hypothetical protein